jgi:CRP-like cAMP-binding protein
VDIEAKVDADRIRNRVLVAFPHTTLNRILPDLEPVTMSRGQIIDQIDRSIDYLYFVDRGLVSFVKTMHDGRTVEVGAVGIDGITDPSSLFGMDKAIVTALVQIPGVALRIRRDVLKREMERDEVLLEIMQRCARMAMIQLVQSAACNRLHALEERCCRWLLIAHDNAIDATFPITHEFLAMMLGVQRSGVSIAARFLQKAGLIEYTRGRVSIMDRTGLEEAACECYGVMRAEFDKLFGAPNQR